MSAIKTVVICAAGVGSRLGLNTPKCLAQVAGKPLIHHQLDLLEDFENVIMVVGYQAWRVINTVLKKRPDVLFMLNHDYANTSTLDSLRLGVRNLNEPFVYLDGDLLVDQQSINAMRESPSAAIGIKRRYSDQPVCVDLQESRLGLQVTGFTRELRDYEWTGLAQINPEAVRKANGLTYVYHAVEQILPVTAIEIDCFEIDTKDELERAGLWIGQKTGSKDFGRIVLSA